MNSPIGIHATYLWRQFRKSSVSVNGLKMISDSDVGSGLQKLTIDVSNFREVIDWEGQSFDLAVEFPRETIQLMTE